MEMKEISRKNAHMLRIEDEYGERIEEILRKMYVDEHKLAKDIASTLRISYLTTVRWLKRAGVYSRRINLEVE
jgi:hypothetical protein